jgi:hypothetical protein
MGRSRLWAVGCAAVFLACEMAAYPFAEMGVSDDWSYVHTAVLLSRTGKVVYNGWATAMLGWQLYFAASMMKLLGPTYAAARISTLLTATATAFLIHRIFVRMGVNEKNATAGTLALMLSPLYMMLSASFMTDLQGVFAICICLYCSLRACSSTSLRATVSWLCLAGAGNVVFGTSRQIAWLGVLVIVPSTAWLLRHRRGVLCAGVLVLLAGAASIAACMHWFQQQPYSLPEALAFHVSGPRMIFSMMEQLVRGLLEIPFLLLGLSVAFLVEMRRSGRALLATLAAFFVSYVGFVGYMAKIHRLSARVEPFLGDWIGSQGFYWDVDLASPAPVILKTGLRVFLTALTMASVVCIGNVIVRALRERPWREPEVSGRLSWRALSVLLGPFIAAYLTLLVPRSATAIFDRYLMPLMLVTAVLLLRAYQDFVSPRLPLWSLATMTVTALFSIAVTHDMFAMYRARIELARELTSTGVAANRLDGGFEYNSEVELGIAGHVNEPRLINPPHSYVPVDSHRGLLCDQQKEPNPLTPHSLPEYGIAFKSDACYGAAPFAPVSYFHWLSMQPTKLYLVKYGPSLH